MSPGTTAQPFTAHDVEFTFNRIIYNEDIPASSRDAFIFRFLEDGEWVEDTMTVTAVDDYTVRVVLPTPFAPFIRSMGTAIYPRHILEPHVEDGTFSSVWGVEADPTTVIGTGPFTIERYVPGERVVLRRNPNYWMTDAEGNSLPYLDSIVHLLVEDLDDELALFEAGETDLHGVTGGEYAGLKPLEEEGNFVIHRRGPSFGTTFLVLNMNPGSSAESGAPYVAPEKLAWFSNQQFRHALAHSIDKERIVAEVMDGIGYPQWAAISPAAGDFHNPDVRKYEYDVEAANDILDGLGWTDGDGDGVREDGEGNPIEFSLVTNAGNGARERITMLIAEGLDDIGVKANYQAIEFGDLVGRLTGLLRVGGGGDRPDRRDGAAQRHRRLAQQRRPAPLEPEPGGAGDGLGSADRRALHPRQPGAGSREAGGALPPRPGDRRRAVAADLHDAHRAPQRRPQRLRQHHPDALRPLGHPLPLPH